MQDEPHILCVLRPGADCLARTILTTFWSQLPLVQLYHYLSLQSVGRGVTVIVWQFLSVRPNPPVLTGKGRLGKSTHLRYTQLAYSIKE